MVDINYDTVKIRELGNNIIKLSQDYTSLITAMQDRMQKVPNSTREWVGPASERFATLAQTELSAYSELAPTISAYGSALLAVADNIENAINQGGQ